MATIKEKWQHKEVQDAPLVLLCRHSKFYIDNCVNVSVVPVPSAMGEIRPGGTTFGGFMELTPPRYPANPPRWRSILELHDREMVTGCP